MLEVEWVLIWHPAGCSNAAQQVLLSSKTENKEHWAESECRILSLNQALVLFAQTRNKKAAHNWSGLFLFTLRSKVWKECHKACTLYGKSDFTLFSRRHAGATTRKHLGVRIRELFQIRDILVVDEFLVFYFFPKSLIGHENSY